VGKRGGTYGGDDFAGLVDDCDRLHERHVGGLLLNYWLSKASFDRYMVLSWNLFAENAVSRKGFRGVLL
jgi:hypothetical protein